MAGLPSTAMEHRCSPMGVVIGFGSGCGGILALFYCRSSVSGGCHLATVCSSKQHCLCWSKSLTDMKGMVGGVMGVGNAEIGLSTGGAGWVAVAYLRAASLSTSQRSGSGSAADNGIYCQHGLKLCSTFLKHCCFASSNDGRCQAGREMSLWVRLTTSTRHGGELGTQYLGVQIDNRIL